MEYMPKLLRELFNLNVFDMHVQFSLLPTDTVTRCCEHVRYAAA